MDDGRRLVVSAVDGRRVARVTLTPPVATTPAENAPAERFRARSVPVGRVSTEA